MAQYIFLDLETTGLDRYEDQITEIGLITSQGDSYHAFVQHTKLPNDWVLKKSDYLTRIALADKRPLDIVLFQLMDIIFQLSIKRGYNEPEKVYIVGANPAFDYAFLEREYKKCFGTTPNRLDYHLIDVEAMVMGLCGCPEVPKLKECRKLLGLPGANEAPHTAMGDAAEVKYLFDYLQPQQMVRNVGS